MTGVEKCVLQSTQYLEIPMALPEQCLGASSSHTVMDPPESPQPVLGFLQGYNADF